MKLNAKPFAAFVMLASIAAASIAWAQSRPLLVQPLQPKAVVAAPVVAAPASGGVELNTPEAVAAREIASLKRENAKLKDENDQLKTENGELKAKVEGYSTLGGSLVHAYCPAGSPTVSRNTSGAENDCAAAGYNCDAVTGQCRASCQTSDMCAGGFTCDTSIQQCVRTG